VAAGIVRTGNLVGQRLLTLLPPAGLPIGLAAQARIGCALHGRQSPFGAVVGCAQAAGKLLVTYVGAAVRVCTCGTVGCVG